MLRSYSGTQEPRNSGTRSALSAQHSALVREWAMKALCWYGKNDVRVETVPEPKILNPRDAIIKTTLSAICGSDLHLLHGVIPSMKQGDILGHEFMGEVLEVGTEISTLKKGDRVV